MPIITRRRFFGGVALAAAGTVVALPRGLMLPPAGDKVRLAPRGNVAWVGLLNEGVEVLPRKEIAVHVEQQGRTPQGTIMARVVSDTPAVYWPSINLPRTDAWAVWTDWPLLGGEKPMCVVPWPEGPFGVFFGTLTLNLDKWYLQLA